MLSSEVCCQMMRSFQMSTWNNSIKPFVIFFGSTTMSHWCHKDYFTDVLTTFLGLERVSCIAVYGGSESSRISPKNILICILRMSKGLMGLWEWVINDRIFIFVWTIPLIWLSLSDKNHDPKLYLHTENSLGQTVMNLFWIVENLVSGHRQLRD